MPEEEKLKLGKGVASVNSRLVRLPASDDDWEADFRALPQLIMQTEKHQLGMVVTRNGGRVLADLTVHGKPGVNDLARLLADAMRRPLDANARRPKTIHLNASPRWKELVPVLEQLGIGVSVEKKLPKIDKALPKLLEELRMIHRAKMTRPNEQQAKVEAMFPAIARYVRGYGSSRSATRRALASRCGRSATAGSTLKLTRPKHWPRRWPCWKRDWLAGSRNRASKRSELDGLGRCDLNSHLLRGAVEREPPLPLFERLFRFERKCCGRERAHSI